MILKLVISYLGGITLHLCSEQPKVDRRDLKQSSRHTGFAPASAMFRQHLGTRPLMALMALMALILFTDLRLVLSNLGTLTDLLGEGKSRRPQVARAPRLLPFNRGNILKGKPARKPILAANAWRNFIQHSGICKSVSFLVVILDFDILPEYRFYKILLVNTSDRKSLEWHLSYTLSRPRQGEHQGMCSSAKSEEARAPTLAGSWNFPRTRSDWVSKLCLVWSLKWLPVKNGRGGTSVGTERQP